MVDVAGRLAACGARCSPEKLGEALGQAVVVENRPGSGGNIAAQQVKRATPDGYALLATSVAFAVNPSLYANAGYEFRDFVGIALGPSTPNIIAVNPSVPANNPALEAPDLRDRLGQLGLESQRNSPAEFAVFLRDEGAKWARAVKESGARAD